MKRYIPSYGYAIAAFSLLSLAACSTAQSNIGGAAQVALGTLNIACQEGAPVAAALAATQDKTAGSYLAYFGSVCNPVTGTALPGVTPDKNTGIWAAALTGALRVYAAQAGVPVAAPAAPPS